jgi:peptidoglycan/LPS O-acetylase OafA/YrhL
LNNQTSSAAIYYPSLYGLRAISILIVVVHHFNKFYCKLNVLDGLPLIADGQFGVNVFFVISGFLITQLLLNEIEKTNSILIKQFYFRRCIRIFPAYFFLLFCYALLQFFTVIKISHSSWVTAITFTKYFNWWKDWYTLHLWSVSIEEHFYLLWPLVFLLPKKARSIFLWGIVLIIAILRVLINKYAINGWQFDLTIFTRFDAIAIGCLTAMHQQFLVNKLRKHWLFYSSIFVGVLICLPYLLPFSAVYHLHFGYILIPFGTTVGTVANGCIAGLMLIAIYWQSTKVFSILNSKLLVLVGKWSYSIYLWQQLFIASPHYWFQLFPYNIICLLLAVIVSYYCIEKPMLRYKKWC